MPSIKRLVGRKNKLPPVIYNTRVTNEGTTLPRRKRYAILLGILAFQLLFFPFDEKRFGFLSVPNFGTIGFFATLIVAHIVNFTAFKLPKDARNQYIQASVAISLISVLASLFRASMVDRFLLSTLSCFWLLISLYLFVLPKGKFGALGEVVSIPLRLISPIYVSAHSIIGIFSNLSLNGSKAIRGFLKLALGLVITVPTAFVLLILLTSADPVFAHYIGKLFSFDIVLSDLAIAIFWRLFFSVMVAIFLVLLVLIKIKNSFVSPATTLPSKYSHLLGPYLMLATTLCLILFSFLVIQFKYLAIGDLADLTAFGIPTFSEYVRKGFIELVLTTGLVYTASAAGLILYRTFKPSKIHLFINLLLIFLSLVLAAMAYRRVYLYMAEHGLTHMRIYGIMVLLIIMLFLITLFARYIIKNHKLYQIELLGASLIVFVFGIANTDYLLARTAPPTVNRKVDYNYLSRLSADDAKSWVIVYEEIKKNTLPIIDKENLSLEERIEVLRASWAISRISLSVNRLVYKYGNGNLLDANIKEYTSYPTLEGEIDFNELKEVSDKLNTKAMNIQTDDIPYDVYQFLKY